MAQTDKKTLWKTRIEDYRSSTEQVAAWCERHNVTSGQLWYWMKKLKNESTNLWKLLQRSKIGLAYM
ncbi:IS66 family insertion sequence element accessory protein TnpA [Brevibacillus migulae]|uniref:IS66 family insertion sequence element accessory protein TnpA n=1 Tax=Brevibacillus migulae TaxID=1644114 RepID=UPI00106DE9AF|nr:hypothetical protein [Brevibacillus migulae]